MNLHSLCISAGVGAGVASGGNNEAESWVNTEGRGESAVGGAVVESNITIDVCTGVVITGISGSVEATNGKVLGRGTCVCEGRIVSMEVVI